MTRIRLKYPLTLIINIHEPMRQYLVILAFLSSSAVAQEHHTSPSDHGTSGSNRLTFGLGHTHISEGQVDGKTQWLATASFSLNFDHWLSDKWAIGLQNDLVLETFKIESHEHGTIERSYPWSLVPIAIFKPAKHWSFMGGIGEEFSTGHNLTLTRLGVEYGHHIPGNWEIGAALVWDNKWNYYNSWGIAITISKIWPHK